MSARIETVVYNGRPMSSGVLIEKPAHSRLPLLDLGIDWSPAWDEFRSSLRDAFHGPRPESNEPVSGGPELRVEWIGTRRPDWSFVAALLSHVAAIWLAVLPIWGWLPQPDHNLAPVQIELTWYPPQDLHPISLPASAAKALRRQDRLARPAPWPQPADKTLGADAYHRRQTILSVPVKLTHPRQTLIQPKSTPDTPKIVQQMPNMVEWAAAQPDLKPQFLAVVSAPRARPRRAQEAAAPDVANLTRDPGSVNIPPARNPALQMPIAPMSTAMARARAPRQQDATAPDVTNLAQNSNVANLAPAREPNLPMPAAPAATAVARNRSPRQQEAAPVIDATSEGNAGDLRRIVALSATPAPPAPEVKVPQGNLAAKISISPDGAKPGAPAASAKPNGAAAPAAFDGSSLPASIQVSGAASQQQSTAAGIAPAQSITARPNPRAMIPAASAPEIAARNGPANIATLAPGASPEEILAGKEVGTLHLNTPNMSSTRGSWIMHFAQLGEDPRPMYRPKGELGGPLPIQTVDPKYPPDTIKEHVSGEVVLYAIIRKDGSIDSIQIVQSLDPRLDKSAADALARWKFNPGTRAGAPVDVEAVIHVPFEYRQVY
jgi:TonB family protein